MGDRKVAVERKRDGRMGGVRRKGERKGEEVEHSRGVTSVGVERETNRGEKQNEEGRLGIRDGMKQRESICQPSCIPLSRSYYS